MNKEKEIKIQTDIFQNAVITKFDNTRVAFVNEGLDNDEKEQRTKMVFKRLLPKGEKREATIKMFAGATCETMKASCTCVNEKGIMTTCVYLRTESMIPLVRTGMEYIKNVVTDVEIQSNENTGENKPNTSIK